MVAFVSVLLLKIGVNEIGKIFVERPFVTARTEDADSPRERLLVMTTNSIPQTEEFRTLPFLSVCDLSATLAWVINRIHYNRSVGE